MIWRSLVAGLTGMFVLVNTQLQADSAVSPFSLYGDRISFSVLRNGKEVGTHEVRFKRSGEDVIVTSQFELKIRALAINFYKYNYTSVAKWNGATLKQLKTDVSDNGKKSRVEAKRKGDSLSVKAKNASAKIDGPVFLTTHWNPNVVKSSKVLNTITGRINNVSIKAVGKEKVQTERGLATATRYRYSGDLQTEAWYDSKGRWLKLRFKADDGSTIEFQCKSCLG